MSLAVSEHVFANQADVDILRGTKGFAEDTNVVKKKLPIYRASPCIENLLRQVVKANRGYYDPKKYFYSLSFKRVGRRCFNRSIRMKVPNHFKNYCLLFIFTMTECTRSLLFAIHDHHFTGILKY
jgi:hypothetical protein